MKTVPLSGSKAAGRVALVDDEDYDLVMEYKWFVVEVTTPGQRSGPYARTDGYMAIPGRRHIFMHNLVADFPKPDHIDGDGLNNQRSNLRPATASQNMANRRPWGRSPYKGVSWNCRRLMWQATIDYEHKRRFLGYHASQEEAARAYDIAAIEIHGEFARLNFPECA